MHRFAMGFIALALAGGCATSGKNLSAQPPAPVAVAPTPAPEAPAPEATPPARDKNGEQHRADAPWIAGAPASAYLAAGEHEQMFGVWVDVPEADAPDVPMALALAVDTSGSMEGEKIANARRAATRLVDAMNDGDRLTLVTFSDRAEVRLTTVLDPRTRRHALSVIEELSAEGGTALHDGLAVAQGQLWSTPDTHLVRRLVVISDGKATVGPSDPSVLGAIAERGMSGGIQVTSLGIGLDYDEEALNNLAIRSSGRLYHLANAKELAEIIESEMHLLQSTVAAQAFAELVPAPGVQIIGLDTAHAVHRGHTVEVPLGALFEGQKRELLVRARLTRPFAQGDAEQTLLGVRLHFKDPARGGIARVQESLLAAKFTDDPALVAEHRIDRTHTIIAMHEAAALTLVASAQANAGSLQKADEELARAESKLRHSARATKKKAEKDKILKQADRLSKARRSIAKAPSSGAGRPAAMRSVALEANDAAMDSAGY